MSGCYCEKHEEWAPTGECRWCEPPKFDLKSWEDINIFTGILPQLATPELMWRVQMISGQQAMGGPDLQKAMNEAWVKMAREDKKP